MGVVQIMKLIQLLEDLRSLHIPKKYHGKPIKPRKFGCHVMAVRPSVSKIVLSYNVNFTVAFSRKFE